MSGGSFDYLCYKEPIELISYQESVEEMAEKLKSLGASEAGTALEKALDKIREFSVQMSEIKQDVEAVMHDVEWYVSCDIGLDTLEATLRSWYEKHHLPFPKIKDSKR